MTLEEVLADERGQAAVLDHNGHQHDADLIRRVCDRVADSAEEYLRFLEEGDAQLRSARSTEWLRGQYAKWEALGHAKKIGGKRYYRMLVIPQRANLSAAREEGRRAAMRRTA